MTGGYAKVGSLFNLARYFFATLFFRLLPRVLKVAL